MNLRHHPISSLPSSAKHRSDHTTTQWLVCNGHDSMHGRNQIGNLTSIKYDNNVEYQHSASLPLPDWTLARSHNIFESIIYNRPMDACLMVAGDLWVARITVIEFELTVKKRMMMVQTTRLLLPHLITDVLRSLPRRSHETRLSNQDQTIFSRHLILLFIWWFLPLRCYQSTRILVVITIQNQ